MAGRYLAAVLVMDRPSFQRILTLVEFDQCSERVLDYALTLGQVFDATVDVLHAMHPMAESIAASGYAGIGFGMAPEAVRILDENEEVTQDRLERMVSDSRERVGHADSVVEAEVRSIRPRDLVEEASPRYDLIVMGTHDRSWLERLLAKSHAKRALDQAVCPVLVVPSPLQDAEDEP
ncbi:MAG: universal stress protein [Myxococcota bacterium]